MALRIWLPLDGNIENKGLSNYKIKAWNTPTYQGGKIGRAYVSGANGATTTNGINISDSNLTDMLGSHCSIAVWVKPLGNHCHYNGTIFSSGNWNATNYSFGVSQNNTQVDVLCKGYNRWIDCTVPVGEWTHLVSVFDDGECRLYKNGVYVGHLTGQLPPASDATNASIGRETYASGYFGFYGLINDVRIYDECLNPKQIKELSKGLVLHYKFDDPYIEPTQNLYKVWSNNCFNQSRQSYTYSTTSGMHYTEVDNSGPYNDCKAIKVYLDYKDEDAFPYVYFDYLTPPSGEYRTISFDYYATRRPYLVFYSYGTSGTISWKLDGTTTGNTGTIPISLNQWHHVEVTIKNTGTSTTGFGYCKIGASAATATLSEYWLFANIQTEEKDHATPLVKGSRTDCYIADSSGYGHKGEISGTALYDGNTTARYNGSINITNPTDSSTTNKSRIKAAFALTEPEVITYNWWGKHSWGYQHSGILSATDATAEWNLAKGTVNQYDYGLRVNNNSESFVRPGLDDVVIENEWHMYTMVFDGSQVKIYRDGTLRKTDNLEGPLASCDNLFLYWSGAGGQNRNAGGNMSDFRIYVTALSENDIKQLYKTSAYIDNQNNTYAYEFKEV